MDATSVKRSIADAVTKIIEEDVRALSRAVTGKQTYLRPTRILLLSGQSLLQILKSSSYASGLLGSSAMTLSKFSSRECLRHHIQLNH